MEPTSVAAALSGLKRASDIVTALVRGDVTLEKAELKLRLADVLGDLAEARVALAQTREELEENEKELERLREAVRLKEEVVRLGDAYYRKDSNGLPSGDPYCSYCIESDGRLFHLADRGIHHTRICHHCKNEVDKKRSYLPNNTA
jgi:hypothetical protein